MNNLIQLIILGCLLGQIFGGVDEKIYNMKYRVSLDSWLIDYTVSQEGYDICMKLEGSCCFKPDQIIKATLTTYLGKKAIEFKGPAEGKCANNQLIIQVIGANGDNDLTEAHGRYTFISDINSTNGSLQEGMKQQFILAIDDQQNLYILKLPSLSNSYTDNDSYNYLAIQVPTASSSIFTFSLALFLSFIILF